MVNIVINDYSVPGVLTDDELAYWRVSRRVNANYSRRSMVTVTSHHFEQMFSVYSADIEQAIIVKTQYVIGLQFDSSRN